MLAMFQDNFPEDKDNAFLQPQLPPVSKKRHPNGSFRVINITPKALKLVDAVVDTSADFDRAFDREGCEAALHAYGDLVKAKGDLVKYIARLMDELNDPVLNGQRTSQVRYQ